MHPARFHRALIAHLERAQAAFGPDLPLAIPAQSPFPDAPRAPRSQPLGSQPLRNQPSTPRTAAAATVATPTAAPAISAPTAHTPQGAQDGEATLATIAAKTRACTACSLATTRTQAVPGEGPATAEVFFVGEAPGATEDRTGRPFVGKADQLLDKIIENAMGMRRDEVFIGNVNKCRPPENRDPQPEEVAACLPYLRAQIAAVRPRVLVTLGRVAAWNLLGDHRPMRALRGLDLDYEGIPVVATWHPAYLLRNPAAKRDTWLDIQRVNLLLGRPAVPPAQG